MNGKSEVTEKYSGLYSGEYLKEFTGLFSLY